MNPTPEQIAKAVAEEEARRINLPAGTAVPAFLGIAQKLLPDLVERLVLPTAIVEAHRQPENPMRFAMHPVTDGAQLSRTSWHEGDTFIVDFGAHLTGYLSFHIIPTGSVADSPVRLRLTFGEIPADVAEPLYPYSGWISAAWLPEEIITIDDLPQLYRVARRHAFRYVKFEVIAASRRFGVRFEDLTGVAVSSAKSQPTLLPATYPDWIRRVDLVAQNTLRDCMQTCFEDGPRRDRRLWVGDLRLQALVNYVTFGENSVVKRCLYLIAGLPRSDGLVNGCVYERPEPIYADTTTLDYAALFCVTLQEYVEATKDLVTGLDLWPVAMRQMDVILDKVSDSDLFVDNGDTWCFIDWAFGLDKSAPTHALIVFALRRMVQLAGLIGRSDDVLHYIDMTDRMVGAARTHLFDAQLQVYISGPDRQVSCATQAWMVMAEIPESIEVAQQALCNAMSSLTAVKPITPYLYHYIVEAMLSCRLDGAALDLVQSYWGAMLELGADTFWEAFDPANPLTSPYGDIHANSYCHAWSCSPAWLFRAKGLGRSTPQ